MSEVYQIIALAILISLIVAFIVLFLNKTTIRYKLRDYADLYKVSLIAKMLDCDFCLCFWLAVVLSIFVFLLFGNLLFLFIPILSTPISRFLL